MNTQISEEMKQVVKMGQALDLLNEVVSQTDAMLTMLAVNIRAEEEGHEAVAGWVLENYVWQLKANMDRMKQAQKELEDSRKYLRVQGQA